MEIQAMAETITDYDDIAPEQYPAEYYYVEIPIKGLGITYQYKIWDLESTSMSILVKEDSRILPWLKPGHILKMRYFCTDLHHPCSIFDTEIQHVTMQRHGRLKGHYLVGLVILEDRGIDDSRWPHTFEAPEAFPFYYNSLIKWRG
jgi:hypothetical protein